jgi:hypothetical protein
VPILRTTGGCCGSVTEQLKAHLGRLGASTVQEHRGCGLLQWVSTVDRKRKAELRFYKNSYCISMGTMYDDGDRRKERGHESAGGR